MKLISTISQIGSYELNDVNLIEGYFYSLEYAKAVKKENDRMKEKK